MSPHTPARTHSGPPLEDASLGEAFVDVEIESDPAPQPTPVRGSAARLLLGAGLVLVAYNLRPVFASFSAVLPEIVRDLSLSPTMVSILTTVPVLCLGLFAATAPALARRYGAERVVLGLMLLLAVGTALRGFGTAPALLVGAVFAGAAIAVGNVLLPGLVKRDFPDRTALMTGLYTMALCGGAASAAGLTVPVEHQLGSWQAALAAWSLPALAVALIWLPQMAYAPPGGRQARPAIRGLWRDPLAWQVTLFMGLQSSLAYIVFGWLAPILRERGLSGVDAGFVVSVSVLIQTASCLAAPTIATRGRDQRWISVALIGFAVIGLLGCLYMPISTVWIWAALQGIGQGSLIAVAMTLIVLRSPDPHVAAQLSSMAQTVGYTIAATGPLLVGLVRGWTDGFAATGGLILAIGLLAALMGYGAGRALLVQVSSEPR